MTDTKEGMPRKKIGRGKHVWKIGEQETKGKRERWSRKACKSHGSKRVKQQKKKKKKIKMTTEWTKKKKGEEERLLGSQEHGEKTGEVRNERA